MMGWPVKSPAVQVQLWMAAAATTDDDAFRNCLQLVLLYFQCSRRDTVDGLLH
jgi:hypothetical protein